MSRKEDFAREALERLTKEAALFDAYKLGSQARQTWNAVKPVVQNSRTFQEMMNIGRKGFNTLSDSSQNYLNQNWNKTKDLFSNNVAKLNNWAVNKAPDKIKQPWEQVKKGWG